MSRELWVGLVTALLAVAATGAALWSSTPQRQPVPDAIELRVTESEAAQAAPASSPDARRAGSGPRAAGERNDDADRPRRARQADQPRTNDRRQDDDGAARRGGGAGSTGGGETDDDDDDDDGDDDDGDNGDDDEGDGDDD